MTTSSKRAYASHRQVCCTQSSYPCSRPLPTHVFTGDTQTHFGLNICGVPGSWCTQVCLSPLDVWQEWGLFLSVSLPLLPSCWGFYFALGCGVSSFGQIQHSPDDGCSAASCKFGEVHLLLHLIVVPLRTGTKQRC